MKEWGLFVRHAKGHHPRLVDAETDEILATNVQSVKKVLVNEGVIELSNDAVTDHVTSKKGVGASVGKYLLEGFVKPVSKPSLSDHFLQFLLFLFLLLLLFLFLFLRSCI